MRYTLYFAYGSNMNEPQFRERCPQSSFLCRAILPGYRFVITSRGYANVLKSASSSVHGMLCAITERDEKELDLREGVARGIYRRQWLQVTTELGDTMLALLYVDNAEDEGAPQPGYLEKVLDGAKRNRLPETAVAAIAAWANR